jgi:hypothetical protein
MKAPAARQKAFSVPKGLQGHQERDDDKTLLIALTYAGTDDVVGDLSNRHRAVQSPFQCPQQAQSHQAADSAPIEGHDYGEKKKR